MRRFISRSSLPPAAAKLFGFGRNRCSACSGIGVRLAVESVFGLGRNRCSACGGIRTERRSAAPVDAACCRTSVLANTLICVLERGWASPADDHVRCARQATGTMAHRGRPDLSSRASSGRLAARAVHSSPGSETRAFGQHMSVGTCARPCSMPECPSRQHQRLTQSSVSLLQIPD